MITLYNCNIRSVVIKRIDIHFHLFDHLCLVFFIFPGDDVVSFLFTMMCFGIFDLIILLPDLSHRNFLVLGGTGVSLSPSGAINMMFLKCREQSTHCTVTFSFVNVVVFCESIVTESKLT